MQAVIAYPELPHARLFPYRSQLALLANFFGPAKGIYLIPLPLKSTTLKLIPASDLQFQSIANDFRAIGNDKTTKSDFCDTEWKPFITFYERYGGGLCDVGGGPYDEFWK